MNEDKVTILISRKTRSMIKSFGVKGETYDDVIRRFLLIAESHCITESDIYNEWKRCKYKSRAELGKRIGLTGQRIGQILYGEGERRKYNLKIDTETLLLVRGLKKGTDRLKFLQLILDGKVKRKDARRLVSMCKDGVLKIGSIGE